MPVASILICIICMIARCGRDFIVPPFSKQSNFSEIADFDKFANQDKSNYADCSTVPFSWYQ